MGSFQALSSRGHLLNRLKLLPPGRLVAVAPVAGVSACLQAVHANPLRGALPLLIGEIRKFPNARLLGCRVCDCTAHCHISYSFFILFLYSLLPFYIQSFISSSASQNSYQTRLQSKAIPQTIGYQATLTIPTYSQNTSHRVSSKILHHLLLLPPTQSASTHLSRNGL